jgi:site-specific DNA recombinase
VSSKLDNTSDTPTKKRAAIYRRVSTGEQATEGYSLDEQERRARAYIEAEGWEYVETFTDGGISGKHKHRPGLDALRGRLDEFDVVVVASLDRLGRSTKNLLELYDEFERRGVALVFVRERLDTLTPVGRLLRTVLSAIAEFERDLAVERTSAGIGGRARADRKPWGAPGYGYEKGENGHWSVNASEATIASRIDRERVEHGMAYNAIATMLNREGVPTRTGGHWTATHVRRILTARYRLGEFWHGGEWHQGDHPAIQSEDMWHAAQALAAKGARYAPSRGGRKPPLHLFTGGLLRCSVCFEAMLPRSAGDKYTCRTRKQITGSAGCSMPDQPREATDRQALDMFEKQFLDLDATRAQFATDLTAHLTEIEAQEHRATREVAEKTSHIARIERDYLAEELTAATYERLSKQLEQDHAAVEAERQRLAANADAVRQSYRELDAEADVLRRLGHLRDAVRERVRTAQQHQDVDAIRTALAQAFNAVYVGPDGAVTGAEPRVQSITNGIGSWKLHGVAVPFPRTTLRGSGVPE